MNNVTWGNEQSRIYVTHEKNRRKKGECAESGKKDEEGLWKKTGVSRKDRITFSIYPAKLDTCA